MISDTLSFNNELWLLYYIYFFYVFKWVINKFQWIKEDHKVHKDHNNKKYKDIIEIFKMILMDNKNKVNKQYNNL